MKTNKELRTAWEARYRDGDTPWDSGITPPEVKALLASERVAPPGLALDLGCGTGLNAAWLADQGMAVIGVEHASQALAQAHQRRAAMPPHARQRIQFVQADVARLPFVALRASYVLDIGCLHGLPPAVRDDYVAGVVNNLRPGGYYHLFAFDRDPAAPASTSGMPWRGVGEDEVAERFTPVFELVEVQRGDPDHRPCRWYLLRAP